MATAQRTDPLSKEGLIRSYNEAIVPPTKLVELRMNGETAEAARDHGLADDELTTFARLYPIKLDFGLPTGTIKGRWAQ